MAQHQKNTRSDAKQVLLLEEGIESLEKELVDKYYQLGKGIYEVADRKIDEINKLVDSLVESKIKLTQARGQVACMHCLALSPRDNRYCGQCGRELVDDNRKAREPI